MNRILITTSLALSLSCGAAFAQTAPQTPDPSQTAQGATSPQGDHHRHAPNPQRQAEFLSKKLSLTPDQAAKVEPILATRDQGMQALWQNQQLTPQERHQQMRSLNEQAQQQMAGVLTPDQMSQLKAMRRHGRRGPNGQDPATSQQPS